MVSKTVVLALAVLLVAALSTFLGVFFGVKDGGGGPSKWVFSSAAVAADAGPCSVIGRWALVHPLIHS